MADRVLSELAGQRGRLILVTGDRHEPTSHELTSPDALAVQLARRTGATVIGLASESNHEWLKSHGVIPVAYGDGVGISDLVSRCSDNEP
jgi:hypothetical protein